MGKMKELYQDKTEKDLYVGHLEAEVDILRDQLELVHKENEQLYNKLKKYRDVVLFIESDYIELSYDKMRWQRDDWRKRCIRLLDELEPDQESDDGGLTPEEVNHRVNEDF